MNELFFSVAKAKEALPFSWYECGRNHCARLSDTYILKVRRSGETLGDKPREMVAVVVKDTHRAKPIAMYTLWHPVFTKGSCPGLDVLKLKAETWVSGTRYVQRDK